MADKALHRTVIGHCQPSGSVSPGARFFKDHILAVLAGAVVAMVAAAPRSASAQEQVCAPTEMLKVVTIMDAPGLPGGHFARVPKTTYRLGSKYGRVEESLNPETGRQVLLVISEPHLWIADLASHRGIHQTDPGPTFYYRAWIFGDPAIRSRMIGTLEFGCEVEWLMRAGANAKPIEHPTLGAVEQFTYSEGNETLELFVQSGVPRRIEVHRDGALRSAIQYLEYSPALPFDPDLFTRPEGIDFQVVWIYFKLGFLDLW